MTILWSNNASTTISGSITATDTAVQLAAGTGIKFPNPTGGNYFVATFYDQATKTINEIVHVSARAGDTCTIIRGQEGTTPQAWSAADIFANLVTAGTLASFVQSGVGPADTSVVYVGTDVSTTPNLVVCATIPVPPNYAPGMLFNIKIKNTNTGPVKLQFNGMAAVDAVRTDGSPMVGANLIGSQEMMFVYNGVNFNSIVPPIPQNPPQNIFYVRTDGNDNNSGFANTPQDAFRTISGAMAMISSRYIAQSGVTIRVADGIYVDGISESSGYIAGWTIIGNSVNPGNVVIDASSTSQAAYPPYGHVGTCLEAVGSTIINITGFSFKSYFSQLLAQSGGVIVAQNCNFTAPISGSWAPIAASEGSSLLLFGTFNYSGASPALAIFYAYAGGTITIGYYDGINSDPVAFIINGNPTVTWGTAASVAAGVVSIYNQAVSFGGGTPQGPQYRCTAGGGIVFTTGNTAAFPGSQPGVVVAPGWVT